MGDELFFEMPMVLSATRLEQPVTDAAVSISVIDRQTIEALGVRTIPEILRLIPGMQVGYSGNEFGDEPRYVVAYHGHSNQYSRQMQVLIDGRSIYEPFFGGINWKAVPVNINDIERIEVSRGPNLATYGSNSFQAAINIITRTAAEDQGSFIQSNIGSNNIADISYRFGGSSGNLDYRITLSSFNDAGLDSANEFDYPDDSHSNNIDYRFDYQIDNKNTLSYQGGFGQHKQQADKHQTEILPVLRTVENTRLFQFIKWESVINQENTLLVQYFYNLSDKKDQTLSEPVILGVIDPFILTVDGSIKSERHNVELTHIFYPNENFKLIWGLNAQTDYVKAPLHLGSNETISNKQYRGFANIEWHLNKSSILNIGALAEKNSFTESELSPRLALTHSFNNHHHVRFGISLATRSPFIYEAQGNFSLSHDITINGAPPPAPLPGRLHDQYVLGSILGKSNLTNEKIISREIVYFGNFLNATLLFNARLFHNDITGFIGKKRQDVNPLVPEDNVPEDLTEIGNANAENFVHVFQNTGNSTITGMELELDYHINPRFRLIASAAVINIINKSNSAIPKSAPQYSFSFLGSKRFNEKYSGSLAYYYVDAFKWTDSRGGVDSHQTLDIRLSRRMKFNQAHGSLSVVIKNILGDYSDYQENPSISTAPKVVHSSLFYLDFKLHF